MSSSEFDIIIRNGTIATESNVFTADIGVRAGKIAGLGSNLGAARGTIDAAERLVLPGGIDPHCHIEQMSSSGLMNSDTFESATEAAALGGNTAVICFVAQQAGKSLLVTYEQYLGRATAGSLVDFAFHTIISNADEHTLKSELPLIVKDGNTSIKVFTTYDRVRLNDESLLDVFEAAKACGALICVHAENDAIISWMKRRLLGQGNHHPKYHALSRPRSSEVEAIGRIIHLADLLQQPVVIFHVSTKEGLEVIRRARGVGHKVFAETCPQYLFLTADDLDKPGLEGAKWICSPPLRDPEDQAALWRGLDLGDLQIVSSDHAPYAFDETAKLKAGSNANFANIASGLPGIQFRLPLLFNEMVTRGRLGLHKFVEVTSAAPARLYDLADRKGSIAIGMDADITIWDPKREVTITDALVHDRTRFTPFHGRSVTGWPTTVIRRGEVIVNDGVLLPDAGRGTHIKRPHSDERRRTQ